MIYQNDIQELSKLKEENMENIFHLYQNENDLYFYNLLQTIHFPQNLPDNYFELYSVNYGDTWPYISFKVYNSVRLWWIITLANDIINPTLLPESGSTLKIPKIEIVTEILTQLTTQEE